MPSSNVNSLTEKQMKTQKAKGDKRAEREQEQKQHMVTVTLMSSRKEQIQKLSMITETFSELNCQETKEDFCSHLATS